MNPTPNDDWLDALGALARHDRQTLDAPGPDDLPADDPRRPLDAAERDDILAAIRAQRTAEQTAAPDLPLADVAAPSPPGATRRRGAIYGLVTLALAAIVALVVLRPATPTLPTYTLEATAGAQQLRGAEQPTDTPTYTPGTRLRLVLRPATAPAAPVTAAITLTGPDGPVATWRPALTVGQSGAVKLDATLSGTLALPPGAYTATLTVTDGESTRTVEHAFEVVSQ